MTTTKAKKARKPAPKARKANPAKKAGAAPQGRDPWGFRLGSKASKAAALYGAKGGATRAEIVRACGSPQMNLLTALEERGRKIKTNRRACRVTGREVTAYQIV